MSLIVRDATLVDAEDILAIYNFAAINTTTVWTDGSADLSTRREWIFARQEAGYPVLVAMKGKDVDGFASSSDFRPFPRLSPQGGEFGLCRRAASSARHWPQPAGRVDRARHSAIAGVEAANAASISLHASLGFVEVGRMLEVGWKFGRFQAGGALYQAHGFVLSGRLERYHEDHSLFLTLDLSGG